jgi:uncharacterized coiled-coil protein SlyX
VQPDNAPKHVKRKEVAVTFRYNDDVDYEPEEIEAPKRKRWPTYVVVVMLAATGIVSAFLWRAYGNNGPTLPSFGLTAPADTGDRVVTLKDLQAFQQPIVAQTQAATQLLAAQQAEIKRLSDQMAALNAKLDALQHSVASVQPPAAAPLPRPVVPPPAHKKPAVPKPAEASPAGAPPPPPLQLNR